MSVDQRVHVRELLGDKKDHQEGLGGVTEGRDCMCSQSQEGKTSVWLILTVNLIVLRNA